MIRVGARPNVLNAVVSSQDQTWLSNRFNDRTPPGIPRPPASVLVGHAMKAAIRLATGCDLAHRQV